VGDTFMAPLKLKESIVIVKPSTVSNLHAYLDKKQPPNMHISVDGLFPTPGFKDPRLAPRIYITTPADGIWDFDFYATVLPGIWTQQTTLFTAAISLVKPNWCLGIRVHGTTNFADTTSDGIGLDPSILVNQTPSAIEALRPLEDTAEPLGGGDLFPWASVSTAVSASANSAASTRPIADILNAPTRIYFFGDKVPLDSNPLRVNIVRSRDGRSIVDVYFG
jgi:hypothetical protein